MGNWGYTYGFSLSTFNRTSTGYLIIQNLPCVRISAVMIKWHKFKRKTSRKLITLNTMISLMCYLNEYWLIDFCILFPIWEYNTGTGTYPLLGNICTMVMFCASSSDRSLLLIKAIFFIFLLQYTTATSTMIRQENSCERGFFAENLHHVNIHKRLMVHLFF